MKKLTVILMTLFGMGQVFSQDYCECFDAEVDVTDNQYELSWYVDIDDGGLADSACVYGLSDVMLLSSWVTMDGDSTYYSDTTYTHTVYPTTDSLVTCLVMTGVYIDDSIAWGDTAFVCDICYDVVWDEDEWDIDRIGDDTSSINEVNMEYTTNGRYYDILGREFRDFNSIPMGCMYIRDRKQYIKNTINEK